MMRPELSVHQRLVARIETVVPGSELEKRKGRGELVLLVRFEDSDGRQWRTGSRLSLLKVQAGVKADELTYTTAAFVRPGDYRVLLALVDTHTMEHSFARRTLHVDSLKGDPLPQAWAGLPPVEILPPVDAPDSWFLPAVKSLLQLPVAGSARVELLVNMTPSEHSPNSVGSLRRLMSAVLPALKVLSGLNAKQQSPSAAMIDLARHRIGFETPNSASLDWGALSKALTEHSPGIIDAKSLAAQSSMRDYFANEVARRAGDSGPPRWLIVLSSPLALSRQDETPLPVLAADPNRHIVYMRFASGFGGPVFGPGGRGGPPPGMGPGPGPDVQIAPAQRVHGPMPGFGTLLTGAPGRGRGEPDAMFPDDLERVLKPMGARIVPVATAETFRKAVATLMEEISAH